MKMSHDDIDDDYDVWDDQINTLVRYYNDYDDDTLDDTMNVFLPGLEQCNDNAID